MNRMLWGLQVLLGVYFAFFGVMHLVLPQGLPDPMSWMYDLPGALHVVAGVAEVAGAVGLIVPGLVRIRPGLTVWAGAGLALVMVAAAMWHAGRGEYSNVVVNLLVAGLLLFVAQGRWRIAPLPGSYGVPADGPSSSPGPARGT